MDIYSPKDRSLIMSSIQSKMTKPERMLTSLLRFLRIKPLHNDKTLPGSPDLAYHRKKKAIFVHGCFWHGHNCKRSALPSSNQEFWSNKIRLNKRRDKRNRKNLTKIGWNSIVVWQCQLSTEVKRKQTQSRVKRFISA